MPSEDEGPKSDQTAEIKPRKKKCIVKRNAGSPLNDTGYANNTHNARVSSKAGGKGKGRGMKASNVSKHKTLISYFRIPNQNPLKKTSNHKGQLSNKSLLLDSKDPNQMMS